MKVVRVITVVLLVAILFTALGCSGKKGGIKPDGDLVYRPPWWDSQNDPAYICTYGQATRASEAASLTGADANAKSQAAQYVEVYVKSMMKNFEQEAGVVNPQVLAMTENVVKVVASAKFSGILVGKTETRTVMEPEGRRYKTWIQLKIPRNEVNKNLKFQIDNEEALYNQFKASQSYQELDREIERY
ncbi:MAG: hypothetical protein FJ042_06680 [Candidatus Cloacimonetes bacterium]|nr:hypothetical protein [Candidatus Cloacimonadota bacterium]